MRELILLGPLLFLAASAASAEPRSNRFNVVLIAIDDLRPELGCYGAGHAQTPHLDALARRSLQFNRHYVQVPTCGASRYALLTGRSPATSGVTRSNAAFYSGDSALNEEQQAGAQTLPELFRRSGYHTTCIGKISHTADGRVYGYDGSGDGRHELPGAWDVLGTPMGPWKRGWGVFFAYAGGRHRESGAGDQDLMEFVATEDDQLPDGMMAVTACDALERYAEADTPFFLGLGFFKPHLPFVATRADWDAFEGVEIPAPSHPDRPDTAYWHRSGEFSRYDAPFPDEGPLAPHHAEQSRRAYLACVRYVDRCVGRVLSALDSHGLAENTVVVVWGDHGWHLGEQQIWGKHTPLELALRSPLIIHVPGAVSATGARSDSLVETLDVYPTLVEVCRPKFVQTHHPLDGTSLLPLLEDPAASVRDVATSYWGDAVSVRTSTHRLVARKKKTEVAPSDVELYALEPSQLADEEDAVAPSGYQPAASRVDQPDPRLIDDLLSDFP